jgi:short-subunit dehydrogenase
MAFAGQVAVITGASSGIGWALAQALAAAGARVGLIARRAERLAQLAEAIQTAGGTAALAAADVGDEAQVRAAVASLTAQLGPVDLLIANAGVGRPTALEPFDVAGVAEMMRINYLGVVHAIAAVLPGMLARGRGHLAAVSSLGAYHGMPGSQGYCASKAAVNTFLEGLRVQLRGRGIAVTTICPGFVRTPMTARNRFTMPFLMEPDEAARRIVRALRRRCKVCNFPWQTAVLMKLTRWLPDWLIARITPP